MKVFTICAIVCAVFALGDSLKCYQCTKGQYSNQEIYRHLPECFDKIENPICNAASYCVKMTINSASENHTIIYECDVTATNVPENAEELVCSTDFCNFKEIGLHHLHANLLTTTLSPVLKNMPKVNSTLSPHTSFENSTLKNSASLSVLKTSLFVLMTLPFFM